MQIPIRVDYGVRALIDLALHTDDSPIRAAEIAQRAAIPEPYLAQVLHTLNKNGLIRSVRGPQGGHALALAPSEIPLSKVMACLGRIETMVGCLDDSKMCIHVPACAQREVWRTVDEAIFKILDSTTIADLVGRSRVIEANGGGARPKREPIATVHGA
jgi:Rrf2 family protein